MVTLFRCHRSMHIVNPAACIEDIPRASPIRESAPAIWRKDGREARRRRDGDAFRPERRFAGDPDHGVRGCLGNLRSMAETPLHRQLGMTDDELAAVIEELGREPTHLELAMYSVMWSEHCSYKSSRAYLSRFPTEAPWVLVGPGEGAGVIDIGDGLAVAVRIESHNHPSAVEPYQGAATGVGGIIRDIFSMGARPIALM